MSIIEIKPKKLNIAVLSVLILFISVVLITIVLKFSDTADVNESSDLCIITIEGEEYDVTSFISVHPGGNIFKCGEDMTSEFRAQHDKSVLINVDKVTEDN